MSEKDNNNQTNQQNIIRTNMINSNYSAIPINTHVPMESIPISFTPILFTPNSNVSEYITTQQCVDLNRNIINNGVNNNRVMMYPINTNQMPPQSVQRTRIQGYLDIIPTNDGSPPIIQFYSNNYIPLRLKVADQIQPHYFSNKNTSNEEKKDDHTDASHYSINQHVVSLPQQQYSISQQVPVVFTQSQPQPQPQLKPKPQSQIQKTQSQIQKPQPQPQIQKDNVKEEVKDKYVDRDVNIVPPPIQIHPKNLKQNLNQSTPKPNLDKIPTPLTV